MAKQTAREDKKVMPATASPPITRQRSLRSSRSCRQGPHPYDILCGKDQLALNNVGNRRFRVTVALNMSNYSSKTNRQEKGTVIDTIVKLVNHNGGRFYKRVDQTWVELSLQESRQKVSHAFRDLRKREKRQAAATTMTTANKKRRKKLAPDREVPSSVWANHVDYTESFASSLLLSSIEEAKEEVPLQSIFFENFCGPQQDDLVSVSKDLFDQDQAEEPESSGTDGSRASPNSVLDPPEESLSFVTKSSLRETLGLASDERDCQSDQDSNDPDSVSLISSVSV